MPAIIQGAAQYRQSILPPHQSNKAALARENPKRETVLKTPSKQATQHEPQKAT